jgi:hypothetical protein
MACPPAVSRRPFGGLFYLDSAKQSVEAKRRRTTDEVDEKKAAK